jgi:hypothetical protein
MRTRLAPTPAAVFGRLRLAAACGDPSGDPSGDPGGDPDVDGGGPSTTPSTRDAAPATGRYLPMAVGASWTYDIVDKGALGTKVQTIEAAEDLTGAKAGIRAYRVSTDHSTGTTTMSWQEDTGTAVVRHLEQSLTTGGSLRTDEVYRPGKLRLDEALDRTLAGTTFRETYTEDVVDFTTGLSTTAVKTEDWTVESVNDVIIVPAGTFTCLRIRRVSSMGSDKRFWFARGVGKVREEGELREESLAAYAGP